MWTLLLSTAAIASAPTFCDQFETRRDCLYAPEPRCSWQTAGTPPHTNSSCVCAIDGCLPVDLCVLMAATAATCNKAALPNGAPCTWNATRSACTCVEKGCPTKQPACSVDQHCDDDCQFPCECAAGNCYLVDECWRFDGPSCESSMWHGAKCCNGISPSSDKGCFLCEQPPLCSKQRDNVLGDLSLIHI